MQIATVASIKPIFFSHIFKVFIKQSTVNTRRPPKWPHSLFESPSRFFFKWAVVDFKTISSIPYEGTVNIFEQVASYAMVMVKATSSNMPIVKIKTKFSRCAKYVLNSSLGCPDDYDPSSAWVPKSRCIWPKLHTIYCNSHRSFYRC